MSMIRTTRLEYAPFIIALLVAQGAGCAVDAQSSEATIKQSAPPVMVPPERAIQFPRTVALQRAEHVTVVSHTGIAAVPNGVTGSPKSRWAWGSLSRPPLAMVSPTACARRATRVFTRPLASSTK